LGCQFAAQEYFSFRKSESVVSSRRPASARGAYASSRTWGGMRWTQAVSLDERRCTRTAKSCGPDTPTLVLRPRDFPADDGGKRARSPGRSRISRKTIAWGMPGVSGASAVNTRVHTPTTMRTRGCGCIAHPAFPAPSTSRGTCLLHRSGEIAPRDRRVMSQLFDNRNVSAPQARSSSPLPPRAQRVAGRGRGWGVSRQVRCLFRKREYAEPPPTPNPSPPLRGGGGE
jgi:hypothetical protein